MSAQISSTKDLATTEDLLRGFALVFLLVLMAILPRTAVVVAIAHYKFKVFDHQPMLLGGAERQKAKRDNAALAAVLILLAFAVDLILFSKMLG